MEEHFSKNLFYSNFQQYISTAESLLDFHCYNRKGLETEEYYSREAAGGDSEGEETEGKTPAMETASMERRRSIIVKRQQVENLTERKKLSEIRLLEISFMVSWGNEVNSGYLARMGGGSDREEEMEGKTPTLEIVSAVSSEVFIPVDRWPEWVEKLMYKFYLIRKGLEKEEYHRQEAAGGDSDGEEETEVKTPALEIASMERNKEHFLSFVQCQKSVNDARNLEQSVSMVKSHIEKKLHKLFSQKSTDLKLASVYPVQIPDDIQWDILHRIKREANLASRTTEENVVTYISDLCDRARESDSQQLRQTLPWLQEISCTNQALDNCTHARQAADD
ncbi:LOW QUALITY PROTEIN: hypothetical protein MAR_021753, partial [Mya arenaria]